ncbi:MAG: hypothetical protein JSU97_07975 [Dehalococcoidia bacterium]|nr:MAG: hypothetical protein JSU97_07975 [Dehalococcoidia bacterium]
MSHKIPLMVAAALAALLVLTAVQAQGPHPPADGPYPRVDVSTTFDAADETSASGTITVCNTSEDPIDVTIESIDDNLYYHKQRPGSWEWLLKATVSDDLAAGVVIAAGECVDGSWQASYNLPDGTINIRNEVQVELEEREMVFFGRDCFDFR